MTIDPDIANRFNAQIVRDPLLDYGKLYQSVTDYPVTYPTDASELQAAVSKAKGERLKVRVRGSGHTFSGLSLPRNGELLVRTNKLNHFRFDQPGTVTIGGGTIVWDARDLVDDYGFVLPVYNGGWAGPTLGGYINAGGFGKSGLSEVYGGLWENVEQITLVDGVGKLHTIDRGTPDFPWVFGSYGQLGVVVEAKLRIVSKGVLRKQAYPQDKHGTVPARQDDDPAVNDVPPGQGERRLIWFSLLVPPCDEERSWQALEELVRANRDYLVPSGGWSGPVIDDESIGYRYVIRFRTFNPPLVYPGSETFLVIGVMSEMATGTPEDNQRLLTLEQDFIQLARDNCFRLYLQAENIGNRVDLTEYYGERIYNQFVSLREKFDPDGILNAGLLRKSYANE